MKKNAMAILLAILITTFGCAGRKNEGNATATGKYNLGVVAWKSLATSALEGVGVSLVESVTSGCPCEKTAETQKEE